MESSDGVCEIVESKYEFNPFDHHSNGSTPLNIRLGKSEIGRKSSSHSMVNQLTEAIDLIHHQ